MISYHVESTGGLSDIKAYSSPDARGRARYRLDQGYSSVIVRREDDEERIVGLYGVKQDGAQVEVNGWIYEGLFRITLEQHVERTIPDLRDCPLRLRRDYPAQAPFASVKVGPRRRPSALATCS